VEKYFRLKISPECRWKHSRQVKASEFPRAAPSLARFQDRVRKRATLSSRDRIALARGGTTLDEMKRIRRGRKAALGMEN